MIKAEELRIGNYYVDPKGNVKKWEFSLDDWGWYEIEDYDKLSGVPLTEEWLLKAGFKEVDKTNGGYLITYNSYMKESFYYSKNGIVALVSELLDYKDFILPLILKYVHQLQNLFYAITRQELTFRP